MLCAPLHLFEYQAQVHCRHEAVSRGQIRPDNHWPKMPVRRLARNLPSGAVRQLVLNWVNHDRSARGLGIGKTEASDPTDYFGLNSMRGNDFPRSEAISISSACCRSAEQNEVIM